MLVNLGIFACMYLYGLVPVGIGMLLAWFTGRVLVGIDMGFQAWCF